MTHNLLKLQYCMSDLLCLFFTFFHKLCSDFDDDVPGAESSVFIWKVSRRLLFFFYLWACFSKVILSTWAGNCPHDCALVRRICLWVYHPSLVVRGDRHNCAVDDNGHIMLTRGNSSQWRSECECFRKKMPLFSSSSPPGFCKTTASGWYPNTLSAACTI